MEAAKSRARTLHIAVDPAADRMVEASRKAERRKMANILFVRAALETLPPELSGQADRITVNYPWGSLLKAAAIPQIDLLSRIAALGKAGASVTMLINMSVFDEAPYCVKLGLPSPPVFAGGISAFAGKAKLAIRSSKDGNNRITISGRFVDRSLRSRGSASRS